MVKSIRSLLLPLLLIAGSLEAQPGGLFSLSLGGGIGFLSFDRRDLWSDQLLLYRDEAKAFAETALDSSSISILPFQKVDVVFPLRFAARVHPSEQFAFGGGVEWIQGKQEAFLLHADGIAALRYTVASWSLFAEFSVAIPAQLLSISGGDALCLTVRRYWLPATWLTSEWHGDRREIWANPEKGGSGWGVAFGSNFAQFGPFRAFFEIEWRAIRASSEEEWNKLLPGLSNAGKASWSLGGIGASIRIDWGTASKQHPSQGDDYVPPAAHTSPH